MAFSVLGSVSPVAAQGPGKGFRKLAPGVETTIPATIDVEETVAMHDLIEVRTIPNLKWSPNFTPEEQTLFEMTKDVLFRRTIYGLEFTFKPLRMIYVDIPQPTGKMQRKLIWYMVYHVKNPGGHLKPALQADGTYGIEKVDEPVRFVPSFVLESHEYNKAYLDRIIPVAMGPIQEREDPNRTLLNSVQISENPIPVSTERADRSVWGVVTWVDVDPRIDFFSVYIQGLTNAYKWIDQEGVYKPGDPPGRGRRFARKTLQLNFWRPGDEVGEHEEEIRYGTAPGLPLDRIEKYYEVKPGVDYTWVYR
jgi:hypothetical protein